MKRNLPTDVANLEYALREMPVPRQWISETVKLFSRIYGRSGTWKNRKRVSANHREWLAAERAAIRRAGGKPWRPKKRLAGYPRFSRAEAWGKRLVLEVYFEALANDLPPILAGRIARMMYLAIFSKARCDRWLRRLFAMVERRGGIVLAPIEAFATERSVPHFGHPAPKNRPAKP
jgi:hypothetical protein